MATSVPDSQDMCNNTAELLSTMRALLRHPWALFHGQYTFPYRFSNSLLNMNYLLGVPYYVLYSLSGNACLAYNSMVIIAFFLNAFSVFLLVRLWTRSWLGAVAAGALCAFYTHRFHDLQDYHYQLTFATVFVLWAWSAFLRSGHRKWLIVFFALTAAKAVTLDYQTVYLAVVLVIMVPLGVVAYPRRMWQHKWLFLSMSTLVLLVLAPLYYPYWYNGFCQPPGEWVNTAGIGRLDFLTWREYCDLWHALLYNITHLRERTTYIVDAPRLPGALSTTLCILGAFWALVAPFRRGRTGLLHVGILLAALAATILYIGPLVNYGGHFYGYTPLARYHVAPPILAVARTSRAFVHAMFCMWCLLAGLLMGGVLACAQRSMCRQWLARGFAVVLLVLMTLEHSPRPNPYVAHWVPPRAIGLYHWLATQSHPSPFVETPYERGGSSYSRACQAVLADQPTATSIGRAWPAWSYFLLQELAHPLTPRGLHLLEVLPYRFWIHHGLNAPQRHWVETQSSLVYATNFGQAYVFENPRPGRYTDFDIIVTQTWMLSFPNVYVISGRIIFSNDFCFVPPHQRRLSAQLICRDSCGNVLARFHTRAELPIILVGPTNEFTLSLQYNPVTRCASASYRASGMFINERWPGDSERCDERIFDTRTIDVTVSVPSSAHRATYSAALRAPPAYWPYRWGVSKCMPCLAGGFEHFDLVDNVPCQRTRGSASSVCLGAPPCPGNTLVLMARAAPDLPWPLWLSVSLNGFQAGRITLSNAWQRYYIRIPSNIWRDVNTVVFRYPRTVIPCLQRPNENDTQQRCAVLAWLDITNLFSVPSSHIPSASNMLHNGSFAGDLTNWSLWQYGVNMPSFVTVQHEFVTSATAHFVHISNPSAKLVGIKQDISLVSGQTYRLRAAARSDGKDAQRIFGGRVAVYLPPEPERELVWLYETNAWSYKKCVFTCHTSGVATVYLHMGYGQVASTGAFTEVMLEELRNPVQEPDN